LGDEIWWGYGNTVFFLAPALDGFILGIGNGECFDIQFFGTCCPAILDGTNVGVLEGVIICVE
jgi:hypothetical protein